jgi:hypothetical protein
MHFTHVRPSDKVICARHFRIEIDEPKLAGIGFLDNSIFVKKRNPRKLNL